MKPVLLRPEAPCSGMTEPKAHGWDGARGGGVLEGRVDVQPSFLYEKPYVTIF